MTTAYRERAVLAATVPAVAAQLRKPRAAPVWLRHDPGGRNPAHDVGVNVRPALAADGGIVLTVNHAAARVVAANDPHTWTQPDARTSHSADDGHAHTITADSMPERVTCDAAGCGRDFDLTPLDLLDAALTAYAQPQRDGRRFVHVVR